MKKVLFSLLVVLTVLSTVVIGAYALDTVYEEDVVALVNGVEVTAEELLVAVADSYFGGTIEIVRDLALPSLKLTATKDGDAARWVINGNGHTLTDSDNTSFNSKSNSEYLIYVTDAIVEINNLTLKTFASGISATDTHADITLNNVNIYSGNTIAGTDIRSTTNSNFSYAIYTNGSDALYHGERLDHISVTINGGEYKARGANGNVLYIRGASFVVNDGTFVGEDSFLVARVLNDKSATSVYDVTSSLSVYGGTFIRPVTDGQASSSANSDAAAGAVIRAESGGLLNIYGGTFANCDGTTTDDTLPRSYCILAGLSETPGYVYIFGGEFYQLSPVGTTRGEIIGSFAGTTGTLEDTTEDTTALVENCCVYIYGGSFYVREGLPNSNLEKILSEKSDTTITANPSTSIQHAIWSDFSVTKGDSAVTKTVYGREFSDLSVISFDYTGVQGTRTIRVKNGDKTYWVSSLYHAFNIFAQNGSTITFLSNVTMTSDATSHLVVLNRNLETTFTSGNSTARRIRFNTTGATIPYAILLRSGNITVNQKTVIQTLTTQAAFHFGVTSDKVLPYRLNVTFNDVRFYATTKALTYVNNASTVGTINVTNCTYNYQGTRYSLAETITNSYDTETKPNITLRTNLTLYTDFTVNLLFPTSEDRIVSVTVGGVTTTADKADIVTDGGVEYRRFRITGIGPAYAMKDIPFTVVYRAEGGFFEYSYDAVYSIIGYAEGIVSDANQPESAKGLLKSVVAYIYGARNHFGNAFGATEEELAALDSFVSAYPADIVAEIPEMSVNAKPINSVVHSLYYDLENSDIRLVLNIIDTNAPLTVSLGGETVVELKEGHGQTMVAVPVRAYALSELITLQSGSLVGTFSFSAYAKAAMETAGTESLDLILRSMYTYGRDAAQYKQYVATGTDTVYGIIYPDGDEHVGEMAEMMSKYIEKNLGFKYQVYPDTVAPLENEILLGATNREGSLSTACPEDSFYIAIGEPDIILFGHDSFYTDMAILYFLEELLASEGSGVLTTAEAGYTLTKVEYNSLGAYLQYESVVSDELEYVAGTKYKTYYLYSDGTIGTSSTPPTGLTLVASMPQSQGACTDGEYIYMLITDKADGAVGSTTEDHSRIFKINPATRSVIAIGPVISVRHGNDMTYDSKNDRLLVLWSYGSMVSELDTDEFTESGDPNPNYLGIKSSYALAEGKTYTTLIPDGNGGYTTANVAFHGLGYDAVNNRYVAATSGATPDGYGMIILSEDGDVLGIIDTPDLGYTKQGADADSYYVYHTQSYPSSDPERDTYIVVSGWDGEFSRVLKIPYPDSGTNTIEIETMMWVDGTLFIAHNRGGAPYLAKLAIKYNV